jgi:N-acetylglucosaminyldiphosphoundecaprenol N-acetyl-beta-D-mannosaminyltransferase
MKKIAGERMEQGKVLGTTLDLTTYEQALERMIQMVERGGATAVAAANTQLIAEAAYDATYATVLAGFEMVVPDGMPLVWALRLDGHTIADRVYGPHLMRHVLANAPARMKHYFFGGTAECLDRLKLRATEISPKIRVVGSVSPPFGQWDEETEEALIKGINSSEADFIWVALGGVRQEMWISKNKRRFKHGVFLAVGDAFALVAGMRSYAPEWMQRMGLTWLFRLMQEPRRLFSRYMRYNTRFVVAFMLERLRKLYGDEVRS